MEPDQEVKRLRQLASRLHIDVGAAKRAGVEGNTAGIETEDLLFSQRTDSRTYFVQNKLFGAAGEGHGPFEGSDDELISTARRAMETLGVPVAEIAETSVLAEQAQEGRFDPDSGQFHLEDPYAGKRLALLTRRVDKLPVWSSSTTLGLTWDGSIGFMQVHWPELPKEVVNRAHKLRELVNSGWSAPDREGAKVESVEAGIIHSPAVGFVMDHAAAIRVIYTPTDESVGKKPTLYLDENGGEVPIPRQFEKFEEPAIEARPTQSDRGEIEVARGQFKSLLLANANYFGNLGVEPKPQLALQKDTFYEEIGCIGYEPALERLEAVVYIRKESGYGGGICSAGTPEYVRFYLSYDDGATWVDQGMGSFQAYDIPGPKPLEYDVTVHAEPIRRFCFSEVLPIARAILSWNNPPPADTPDFTPVWGEVQEARIQIAPRTFFLVADVLQELDVELTPNLAQVLSKSAELQAAKPKALTVSELHDTYKDTDVPGHRYLFKELKQQEVAGPAPVALKASGFSAQISELGIDIGSIIGQLFDTDGNTSYEELKCIGLNPIDSALIATLTMKLSSGYSGDLCTTGSKEYVAFWIDYGAGWQYAGTTSVDVHDLKGITAEGIEYAVFLPVDLSAHRRPCDAGPVTARVRAILSWQTPPPWWNPNYVPTWGNREETTIHIAPGEIVSGQVPFLSRLGDIPESQIAASGKATGSTVQTGFAASDSPFGGLITVAGHISNPIAGQLYRVMRKPHGAPDSAYVPLTNEPGGLSLTISTWDFINGWQQTTSVFHADAQGYYPFEDYSSNHAVEGDLMMRWYSTMGEHGMTFDVRIDLSVDGNPAHDVHSNVVTALVDNVDPTATLDIDLGMGAQCADFNTGAVFTGSFDANDDHFGSFSFEIQPSGPAHGHLPAPASGASVHFGGSIADPGVSGGTYTLTTGVPPGPPAPMDPCGYALILHVWDRTNVNSGGGSHHAQAAVGFCIRATT